MSRENTYKAFRQWGIDLYIRIQKAMTKKHRYVPIVQYAKECPDKAQILSNKIEHLQYAASDVQSYDAYLGRTMVETGEHIKLHDGGEAHVRTVRLRNATCYAYSDIIVLADGRCVYDIKEIEDIRPVTDYRDSILWEDHDEWCKLKKVKQTVHISKGIKIGGMFGFNFYHLLFQLLPRMMHTAEIDKSIPLLVDRKVAEIGNMQQLVNWFNAEKREIIYLDEQTEYKVEELYVITSANLCIPNFKPGYSLFEPKSKYSIESIEMMRSVMLPHRAAIKTPEKIYICRRNATKLRSYNEEELYAVVKDMGFVDVYPETMTVGEQIALFSNAKMIISPEGAALSNTMFIQKDCKVVVMYCMPTLTSEFAGLIKMRGADLIEIYDVPQDMTNPSVQRNYYIDPEVFRRVIEEVIGKR